MLVKNAKIIMGTEEVMVDILIQDGKFVKVGRNLAEDLKEEILDAKGHYVLPGMIDAHTHMRTPGFTHKEDISSGSKAAIRGGVTSFFDMPNTDPATVSMEALEEKRNMYQGNSYADYAFYFGGTRFDNHEEVQKAAEETVATKIFFNVSTGDMLVEDDRILENIFHASKRVAVHAEREMVEKAIQLARKIKKPLYLCHISLEKELEYIREAKEIGIEVYGEVTPHHLFLNEEDREQTEETKLFLRTKPELKTKKDNEALWKALQYGILDTIGTDHAPHLLEEKKAKLTFGMPSVEHSLEMMWKGVEEGKITLPRLQEVMCENPANIFGLKTKGKIAVGYDADFVIVDEKDHSEIQQEEIISKAAWSPYVGQKRGCKVLTTVLRGEIMYHEGIFGKKRGREILKHE
ncbi:MAG TPA: dihydroorotase family protein [Fusobacterium sp.]|uniref:dihydroorotase n=1 Tax=Fusobacterium sp. TaxID=68766 RepID=UPI002F3F9AB9